MKLIHFDEWLNNHDCYQVLTIHDEVVVDAPIEIVQEAGARIRDLMIQAADMLLTKMPIKTDVEVFEHAWNDENSYKLKF